jgi:hypothetical protein
MTEQILLDYLQGITPVEELSADLKGSQKKTGYDTVSISVKPLAKASEFILSKEHLKMLSVEMLSGKLSSDDITTIAFAIICSESFSWTKNIQEDEIIIETVLYDWDNPEVGFPLTIENMKKWKEYLETGVYNFNADDLT